MGRRRSPLLRLGLTFGTLAVAYVAGRATGSNVVFLVIVVVGLVAGTIARFTFLK